MPRHTVPRKTEDVARAHSERLYKLERRTDTPTGPTPHREIVFSFYGALLPSTSGPWSHPDGATIASVVAQLGTAGTSTTTVRLLRNGAAIATLSLPSGSLRKETFLAGIAAGTEDRLQAEITSTGSGASSLTVQVGFR